MWCVCVCVYMYIYLYIGSTLVLHRNKKTKALPLAHAQTILYASN